MNKSIFTMSILSIAMIGFSQSYAQPLRLDKYKDQPQTITNARIASASVLPDKWDKAVNWTRIENLVRRAADEGGADVVVTPEGALEGYVINEVNREKDENKKKELTQQFFDLAEPMDGPYIQKACALCSDLGVYLVLGFLEQREDSLYNTAILIDPDGDIVGRYSKTHFAQGYTVNPDFYKAGDEYPVFDTPFGKIGILICYDRQLPEPARILALKGAQILFVPSFGSYTDEVGWNTTLLRTRAYENHMPLIFSHPFQSLLITSHGELKAVGKSNEVVYYDVNTSPDRYKDRFENRRPASYGVLIEGEDPGKAE
ncbi:MAG: carbon-nitrogen hydrolase family protein [bacterium]